MNRFVCIHGHFYQPPRENPWLEEIEVQDSASPYRDWNERITAECYSPNAAARILQNDNTITAIINNYSKISFNFGPTLLSWMEEHSPDVYEAILQADELSKKNFSGHGSAIAQVYNHMIMPLSNKRDKQTQVIWGIEDFRKRFNREPEGMWLAETAVNTETLEVLADNGIKYTILAPRQAKEFRHLESNDWVNVEGGKIDPKQAYICNLPSGKSINLFFYDGPISQELAFGPLLKNGENLANRLTATFRHDNEPQLAHIATDGETYGHHQKHGDMALAYCLHYVEEKKLAKLTIYGEFLEKFPPKHEVKIVEDTSWSCLHGIERWKSDCGCNSGREGWNQQWRAPLRMALDWLRDELAPFYEKEAGNFTNKQWEMRNRYIEVILDRSPENIKTFFQNYGVRDSSEESIVKLLKLLEMQRHAMLMYTSCGWFFDEISGIETVQVIQYAARAIQLAKELGCDNLEDEFVQKLETVPSNLSDLQNGANVYNRYVKPAIIDLMRVAAHYAVSSLFEEYSDKTEIFAYEVFSDKYEKLEAGKYKMIIGRAKMRSCVTYDERMISFAFIHLGDHNINGGVRESLNDENYQTMHSELKAAFEQMNVVEIIHLMDKHFGTHNFNLWHLFKDESRKVFNKILGDSLEDIEFYFRQIYDNHYPIMTSMLHTQTPLPKGITTAVEFLINEDFKNLLEEQDEVNFTKLKTYANEAKKWNVELNKEKLQYAASKKINKMMDQLMENPEDIDLMKDIDSALDVLHDLGFSLDIWRAQNVFFYLVKNKYETMQKKAEKKNGKAKSWISLIHELQEHLQVKIV